MDGRRFPREALVAVLAGLVIVGAAVLVTVFRPEAETHPLIDQGTASALARDFFNHAHGEGAQIENVTIGDVQLGVDESGRRVWKVQINGDVVPAGKPSTSGYVSHMWLYVDAGTGAVRVYAHG